jgi:NADH dehydrogenase
VTTTGEHAERFTHLRPLMFTIVYEILGSATESDDLLQDSYLRWADVDLATVRDTKSYLAQLVTSQALNALRARARRREDYVGPWLPEPLLLDQGDASSDVVLAESVSMAMLVLLETLTPDERAVFVLREVFGFDYDEIAGAVGKSAATVRQRTTQITEQFLTAASTGDMDGRATETSGSRRRSQQRPCGRHLQRRRQSGGCLRVRSHRRRDHQPVCDAQPRQAGRRHDPSGDQPIVTSTTSAAELSHSGSGWCLEGMTEHNAHTNIVIIGGGYAGVMAANRLTQRATVTMVNPRGAFVERIRLHQLVAGNDDAIADYSAVLSSDVRVVVDTATNIDAAARTVRLASGETLRYDYLIYAVGSTGTVPDSVPGAAEFAYPLSEFEQAQRLRSRLADVPTSAPIVVVGGGLTGIETAAEFAEAGRSVTLVGAMLAPSLSVPGRRSVAKRLSKLGVTVVEDSVEEVTTDSVVLAGGQVLPSAATVWTAGFGVPGLAAASGLATDELGRLLTDETLTSVSDPRVVAAGDAASPSNLPYRMSCQASLPMGAVAANTILSRIEGTEAADITVPMAAQCISLGRGAGTVQLHRKDDTPRDVYVGGRTGAFIKEQICVWTLKWMAGEAKKPGSYNRFKGYDRAPQLAQARQEALIR